MKIYCPKEEMKCIARYCNRCDHWHCEHCYNWHCPICGRPTTIQHPDETKKMLERVSKKTSKAVEDKKVEEK